MQWRNWLVFSGGHQRRSLLPPILRNETLRKNPNVLAGLGWSEQTFAMKSKAPPGFINVDLDIVSRAKLGAIEASLSQTAYSLYSDRFAKASSFFGWNAIRTPRMPTRRQSSSVRP